MRLNLPTTKSGGMWPPSTGVSQLRDFLDVRDRSARPACLGEEVERHVLVVADRREGLIHIRPRIWIARYSHLP